MAYKVKMRKNGKYYGVSRFNKKDEAVRFSEQFVYPYTSKIEKEKKSKQRKILGY